MALEKETPALEGELAKYDAEEAAGLGFVLRAEVRAFPNAVYTEKLITLLQQKNRRSSRGSRR